MVGISQWSRDAVRARVEAAMLSQVIIRRGASGEQATFDPDTLTVSGIINTTTIYSGQARIRVVQGGGTVNIGGAEISRRGTIISIPIDSMPIPHRDDQIEIITDDAADSDLDGRLFRVLGVDGGSLMGDARRMGCDSWYPSTYYGAQS